MATPVLTRQELAREEEGQTRERRRVALCLVSGLTAAALVIHGFHPYAEDGGLYLAGVKKVLDPSLYQSGSEFVLGHLRFSLFAPAVAWLVRNSGLNLETVVLLLHLASIWLTLAAAWMLAGRCFDSLRQRVSAVVLFTVWLTLPIAGTSLMLMDPYVTARSISTPMTLFALVCAVDLLRAAGRGGRWKWRTLALMGLALLIAAAAHPLMAGYGFACVMALAAAMPRRRASRLIAGLAIGTAAVLAALVLHLSAQPESLTYKAVALSRYYWFLSQWQWYELVGAIAPLIILALAAWQHRGDRSNSQFDLAWMGVTAGTIALVIALLFARVDSSNYLVARMQPMRIFQLIYVVMILLLGGELVRWLGRQTLRWTAVLTLLAATMIFVERMTFPSSQRIELSEADEETTNSWVQAFEWIREHTPKNAVFALDADYITHSGEDAQSFRAIAERSALPDYSKDGGEAAITPSLTDQWNAGQAAQANLSKRSDTARIASLAHTGVNWIVLERHAQTGFACDFQNDAVKVCRLPKVATETVSTTRAR